MHRRSSPRSQTLGVVALSLGLVSAVTALASSASGCAGDPPGGLPLAQTTAGAGGSGTGGADAVENHGAELFADLEADLVDACATCHDAGGIADTPFLAGPDRYASISTWPGVVVKDAQESLLLTWPRKGGAHSGTNIDADDLAAEDLAGRVTAWLEEEAKGISSTVPTKGPTIDPFAPILGFNAVYLDALGEEYKGMALTFNATELTGKTLELSELEVHPTADLGVHLVHPLFVVYPVGADPDPDPVDSCSNVDQTFEPGQSATLGPGVLVLTNWVQGAKLSVAFEKIEPYSTTTGDGGVEGGTTDGCKDVTAFVDNASDALSANCVGCHGGTNPNAKAAVDMSKLATNAAATCGQVKNRVSPDSPADSQLFVTTDPNGNAAHPFKFGGNDAAFDAFKASVSIWIAAEK